MTEPFWIEYFSATEPTLVMIPHFRPTVNRDVCRRRIAIMRAS